MLEYLHVKNLALIDEAEVEFGEGLNILTGETGAGKSIIIGSVSLALGAKASKDLIRKDCDYALVELIFHVTEEETRARLHAMEIECEQDRVILMRKITDGRSISRINAQTVPIAKLKEAAEILIDIHGQHEHQSLLYEKNHLVFLDAYAKEELQPVKEEMKHCYRTYTEAKRRLAQMDLDEESRKRELDFIRFEIEEITQAELSVGEDDALEEEYRYLNSLQRILEHVQSAYRLIAGEDENCSESLGAAVREIETVSTLDKKLAPISQQLSDIDSLLSDVSRELSSYLMDTELDPQRLYEVETRLNEINRLKSKYGADIGTVLLACEKRQQRYDELLHFEELLAQRKKVCDDAYAKMETLCGKAGKIRRKYASQLTDKVTEALKDLNFLEIRFEIQFTEKEEFAENGKDKVTYLVSMNPGEPLKPLMNVASGGELSRIMLALKSVLAENDRIGTLIFDEIDTGISGRTAQMVSEKMSHIAKDHQVICITHLPQIAAMADTHFAIEKQTQGGNTTTHIRTLTEEETVSELARMSGGVAITERTMESAKEMRRMALLAKKTK